MSLDGKSILITGGASGLGAALAQLLAESGAFITIGDIQGAQAQADSLNAHGFRAQAITFDVGDVDGTRRAVDSAIEAFGRLDVLVNNAGTDRTLPMAELSPEAWRRVIDTNLNGPFFLSKYAADHMRERGSGHIVNVASTAAKRAWPNASAYHASKWGLLGLSHAMHAELRRSGIKVTAVIAGGMRTPFLLDRFPDIDAATLQDPANVAQAIRALLLLPVETVVGEITVLPMQETSWP